MKKKIFALIAIAAFGFASCQKPENPNNEPEPEPTPAELVAGVYDGQLSILLGDFPFGDPTDQQVELIAGEDGTVTLSITDLSVMNGAFTFDQISLEGCPATENEDGSISVSTEGTVTLTFESVGNCDIDMTGSIKDGEAVLDLDISPEMLEGTVTAHFEGTRSETAAE
jgi:hypothetical protein